MVHTVNFTNSPSRLADHRNNLRRACSSRFSHNVSLKQPNKQTWSQAANGGEGVHLRVYGHLHSVGKFSFQVFQWQLELVFHRNSSLISIENRSLFSVLSGRFNFLNDSSSGCLNARQSKATHSSGAFVLKGRLLQVNYFRYNQLVYRDESFVHRCTQLRGNSSVESARIDRYLVSTTYVTVANNLKPNSLCHETILSNTRALFESFYSKVSIRKFLINQPVESTVLIANRSK